MPHMHIPELTGATFKLDAKKLELMYGHDPIALVPLNSSKKDLIPLNKEQEKRTYHGIHPFAS